MIKKSRVTLVMLALGAVSRVNAGIPPESPGGGQADANGVFQTLENRYLDEFSRFTPADATRIGDHRHDGEVDDLSRGGREAKLGWDKELLASLEGVDARSCRARVSSGCCAVVAALRYDIWQLTQAQHWAWDPLLYNELAGDAINNLMAREYAPLSQRLMSASERLSKLPRLYEQERQNIVAARVPRVYAEQARARNPGLKGLIAELIAPNLTALTGPDRERLQAAIDTATKANTEQQRWLEEVLVPNAKGNFRVGPAMFDAELRFVLQSSLDRAEIRRRAEAELKQVRDEMYPIARAVLASRSNSFSVPAGDGPEDRQRIIKAALELAAEDHPPRDQFPRLRPKRSQESHGFREGERFDHAARGPHRSRTHAGVHAASAFPRVLENPGPLDVGQKTFYDMSPVPPDWDAKRAESFLREYNTRGIES